MRKTALTLGYEAIKKELEKNPNRFELNELYKHLESDDILNIMPNIDLVIIEGYFISVDGEKISLSKETIDDLISFCGSPLKRIKVSIC